jgi:hypothetical protein
VTRTNKSKRSAPFALIVQPSYALQQSIESHRFSPIPARFHFWLGVNRNETRKATTWGAANQAKHMIRQGPIYQRLPHRCAKHDAARNGHVRSNDDLYFLFHTMANTV